MAKIAENKIYMQARRKYVGGLVILGGIVRIMSVDYGLKRIGIALSDMLQITVSPFDTIGSENPSINAKKIIEIAKNNEVSEIVVGIPVNMSGSEGSMVKIIRLFIDELKRISDLPIETINESLSTVEAQEFLADRSKKLNIKDKGGKDKIAAALILQRYMEKKCAI
ncbi:MAG: Holliday junction resolvase RuvX [Elusimicrobiota bacterium]|nr:Holliday junction resolvase RuvX [Elusimicrobiota bacterium]